MGTMLAADSCHTVRSTHASLSHDSVTYGRSPEVSTTAFSTQPPDLRLTPLMDMDFAIIRSLVRRSRLISGFCSSARAFARRFFRTPFCIGALALRYPSPPSGWGKTYTSKLSHMLGTRNRPRLEGVALACPAKRGEPRTGRPRRGLFSSGKPRWGYSYSNSLLC
jgi:hypothetical protein